MLEKVALKIKSKNGGVQGRKGGGGEGKPSPHKGSNHASKGRRIIEQNFDAFALRLKNSPTLGRACQNPSRGEVYLLPTPLRPGHLAARTPASNSSIRTL